ncbi:MAG: YraN family protein [Pseudomonadota bacterium]
MTPADRCEQNRLNGIAAENRVALNYQRCGFELVKKRFRAGRGEIDLIFKHAQTYYFTEVKRASDHETALSYIHSGKVARIEKTILAFLEAHDLPENTDMRVDAALVDRHNRIKVIPNILH